MRRVPFKRWTGSTAACRYPQGGLKTRLRVFQHKTLSLYVALNPPTGEIFGQIAPRPTSQEFVVFLEEVVATKPLRRQVHVILDNFATHKKDVFQHLLQHHPNVNLHFTPTDSSWLN